MRSRTCPCTRKNTRAKDRFICKFLMYKQNSRLIDVLRVWKNTSKFIRNYLTLPYYIEVWQFTIWCFRFHRWETQHFFHIFFREACGYIPCNHIKPASINRWNNWNIIMTTLYSIFIAYKSITIKHLEADNLFNILYGCNMILNYINQN